jgi:lipopolysaccharide export LptBFGC system permease protein LptF
MTLTKRFLSITVIIATLLSMLSAFSISASAATGKSKGYGAFQSKTITVTTNKSGSPYMTFTSTGTASYQGSGAKAPILSLKVYNHNTKKTQYYRVTGSRFFGNSVSSKLKLNKNTKYTVTVGYIYDKSINWGTYGIGMYKKSAWYDGTWKITATSNLNYNIK